MTSWTAEFSLCFLIRKVPCLRYDGKAMETTRELSLRDKIRRALVEEMPEASEENVERALNRIMTAVDAFERAASEVLTRYDKTFADLAQ